MRKTVGAFEGKTHFSALIADAERGETTIVTKKGRPVAQIGPVSHEAEVQEPMEDVIARILSRDVSLGASVRSLIDEGRR